MTTARPSFDEITLRIWNKLRPLLGITRDLESTQVGLMCKAIGAEMSLWWDELDSLTRQASISTMSGASLDSWGALLGIFRKQALQSTSTGGPRPVRFTNNGSLSIVVPANTRIWDSNNRQLAYFTTEGLNLGAGQAGEVHVTAAETGSVYNVGIGQLNEHNVPNVSVSVTNLLPIENGSYQESDDSFRERLIQEFRRRRLTNVDNTIAAIRDVPGVRDALMLNKFRGDGTFDVIVIPENPNNTAAVVDECNRLLGTISAAGVDYLARPPRNRHLIVTVNIKFAPDTGDRRDQVRESVRQQIRSRIDNLAVETGLGEGTLNLDQIRASVLLADSSVVDATTTFGLDGAPLSAQGLLSLKTGERLILLGLEVN